MTRHKISLAATIQDPGLIYRPMFCKKCGDIRWHTVKFVASERNERGIFVWFEKICSGLSGATPKNPNIPKLTKPCQLSEIVDICGMQWKYLASGKYI